MLRFTISAVASLLLGCVCVAQRLPEVMAPAQRPAPQTAQQKSFTRAPAPSTQAPAPSSLGSTPRPSVPGGSQAAPAASSAAGQATGTPRALLPVRPPRVTYTNGMLGIVADNSTLADVLSAVRQKTGAAIEAPPSAASERVVVSIGPAPANSVLMTLLNGSRFDYIILGSQQASGAPQRLILREKQNSAQPNAAPPGSNPQTFAQQNSPPVPAEAPQPEEEYVPEAEVPDEAQPEPQGGESQAGAAGQQNQQQPGQQQVKTPEQLLEELKLMQQQQQQQMQQQQQQGQQSGSQPQQENDPNKRPQNNQDQQPMQPQTTMPPDGEAPPN